MPLIKSPSKKALKKNIKTEIEAGKDPDQAAAIAYSEQRKAKDNPSGKLNKQEKAMASQKKKHRKDVPEGVFLEPGERKYPVKVKKAGVYKYDRDLLLAAEKEANMHGKAQIARKAAAIREREFGGKDVSAEGKTNLPGALSPAEINRQNQKYWYQN